MSLFHSKPAPYTARRDKDRIVVENTYTRWVHDLARGGELTEAVVRFGRGTNLLVAPQCTGIGIRESGPYHAYRSDRLRATRVSLTEKQGDPCLRFTQCLADSDGRRLKGVSVRHSVVYRPWGYALHTVELRVSRRVTDVAQVQVGTCILNPAMDAYALRPATAEDGYPLGHNNVRTWRELGGGRKRSDCPAELRRHLPLSILLLERGVEGIEFALGDALGGWDGVGRATPGWQQFYLAYRPDLDGYEVRFCPLDANLPNQHLEGVYRFGFRMALPHVRERIVPLRPCTTGTFQNGRGFENRWPTQADIDAWRNAGVTLMRVHNDGDPFGTDVFWRDGVYPPYPPEEMAKLETLLARANAAGIRLTPYFSTKQLHPEAPAFKRHAEDWRRMVEPDGAMIHNFARRNEFGAQMCLKTKWLVQLKRNIDLVLRKHPFRGVYYDWCAGFECCHPAHMPDGKRHWDQAGLQNLLEWSHDRVGPDGEVYLHLTGCPNLPAENLASLVLTEEQPLGLVSPEMFTPHVHFLNIAPRQICSLLRGKRDKHDLRRVALCALLHHAGVSGTGRLIQAFHAKEAAFDPTPYRRHTAPGEGKGASTHPKTACAAYWNAREALVLVANLANERVRTEWALDGAALGMGWAGHKRLAGRLTLKPLELRRIRVSKSNARRANR